MLNSEQTRIARDLHLGCNAYPYDTLVRNKAGDVMQIINGMWAETLRADQAEAKLKALQSANPQAETANDE